jgi:hypothetical protein
MSECASCQAPIVWAITAPGGRRTPVDRDPVEGGNLVLESKGGRLIVRYVPTGQGTHVSHFATCPQASEWRNRGRS